MRKSILSFALIAGLFLPIGASQAQDTNMLIPGEVARGSGMMSPTNPI